MLALALTVQDAPQAVSMSFHWEYAERYDWLAQQLSSRDGGIRRHRSHLPHRAAGQADDHMGFSFPAAVPTDDVQFHADGRGQPALKACKHCNRILIAGRLNAEFCSPQCKNCYNVYKSRGRE